MFKKEFLWISATALLIYCLVFVWFTQPLVSFFDKGYIGIEENGDVHVYLWNIFNFKEQIHLLKNPFYTNYLFAPEGTSLVMHAYTPLMGAFALLFSNNIVALNAFLFINFILSAYGAYLLSNKLINNPLLSIAAGIVYAFCPYKLLRLLEHYNLLFTAAIPFFILCFLKAFAFSNGRFFPKIISNRYFYYCFGLGIIMLLCDYYVTFSVLYFCLFYALYYKFFAGINYRSVKFWLITVSVLIFCHLVLHQFKVFGVNDKGALWWSGDILGYIIPHFNSQWLYNGWFAQMEKEIYHYPGSVEYCMFLGYTILVLLFITIIWLFKNKLPETLKPFAFITLIFFLMTVPDLKIGGKSFFNLPVSFFHYIPFFNNIRSPTRMISMVALVFMPLGLYVLSSSISGKRVMNYLVGIGLIVFLLFEYKPVNYPVIQVNKVPMVVNVLRDMPEGNLLEIPFGIRDGFMEKGKFETKQLWYQTIHKKPIPGGYISRVNQKIIENYNSGLCSEIDSMQKNYLYISPATNFDLSVRYILIAPGYRANFEPFFDRVLKGKVSFRQESEGYLLYKLF